MIEEKKRLTSELCSLTADFRALGEVDSMGRLLRALVWFRWENFDSEPDACQGGWKIGFIDGGPESGAAAGGQGAIN